MVGGVPTELHVPAHQDSDSARPTKVAPRKHSVYSHFPNRNGEVCLRTKRTKAPCRRCTGEALPRAENFGDLIPADQKVLNEGCESGDNHRYAILVQDLATKWILSVQNKDFTRDGQEFKKVLGADGETKSY